MPEPTLEERGHQLRIALVLYGGVSLAVYENGVAAAFYNLVRGRGIFGPLLELLDSDATVDVIAGASAGGINGLLLAAALESGQEFEATADLWREHGDFGALLRPPSQFESAESLLDGEGYYHDKLEEAFRHLCRPSSDSQYRSPHEIDLFLTGTDLNGRLASIHDHLNQSIEDLDHRVVFHLKHRHSRRRLGLPNHQTQNIDPAVQSQILASIARITSSFPGAFPPFELAAFTNRHRPFVQSIAEAMDRAALRGHSGNPGQDKLSSHRFTDGGVLNNKPFEPAIRAIFSRMPGAAQIDRRLFFVEPDPQTFSSDQKKPSPLKVAWSAISTLPSHQSIGQELARLTEHNSKIRWLKELQNKLLSQNQQSASTDSFDSSEGQWPSEGYRQARISSLAQSFFLDGSEAPSASQAFAGVTRAAIQSLEKTLRAYPLPDINTLDYHFQLRRNYHFLYALHDHPLRNSDSFRQAAYMLGRVIKVLRVVATRQSPLSADPNTPFDATAEVHHRRHLLDAKHQCWASLELPQLTEELKTSSIEDFLPSRVISQTFKLANDFSPHTTETRDQLEPPTSILLQIEKLSDAIIQQLGSQVAESIQGSFERGESILYPLEFASSVHELDEIEFARVSPKDAQMGLSRKDAHSKITGDRLAHFSAFLRRDWRSNDILWGHVDGICQIVRMLLDKKNLARLIAADKLEQKTTAFLRQIESELKFPKESVQKIDESLKKVISLAKNQDKLSDDREFSLARDELCEAIVLAAQIQYVEEKLELVYTDNAFQDIEWKLRDGPSQSQYLAEEQAASSAKHRIQRLKSQGVSLGEAFQSLQYGASAITGQKGEVPLHVLGEYTTSSYLLIWNMLKLSIGSQAASLGKRARLFFRTPVVFLNNLFRLTRQSRILVSVIFSTLASAALAMTVAFFMSEQIVFAGLSAAAALVIVVVGASLSNADRRKPLLHRLVQPTLRLGSLAFLFCFAFVFLAGFECGWGALRVLPAKLSVMNWSAAQVQGKDNGVSSQLKGLLKCPANDAPPHPKR